MTRLLPVNDAPTTSPARRSPATTTRRRSSTPAAARTRTSPSPAATTSRSSSSPARTRTRRGSSAPRATCATKVRLDLDRTLTDWLRLGSSSSFIQSSADLTPNGGIVANYGVLTNFLFSSNDRNFFPDPVTGEYPAAQFQSNPLEVIARWKAPQGVQRYIGGVHLTATPLQGFTADYRFGYDGFTETAERFIPRGSSAVAYPTGLAGRRRAARPRELGPRPQLRHAAVGADQADAERGDELAAAAIRPDGGARRGSRAVHRDGAGGEAVRVAVSRRPPHARLLRPAPGGGERAALPHRRAAQRCVERVRLRPAHAVLPEVRRLAGCSRAPTGGRRTWARG